ncbi:tyrosine--tRNA ligase [Parafrankia discariae]|uniref:tyrosine--tRNA ligase n=1 Tax=Parafrankia discariae TaxID=365528 RepID=UPI00037D9D80|nr:tyrosine--tRNA ligase [Parafrankia discariae]
MESVESVGASSTEDLFDELVWRGLVADTSDEQAIREMLREPITLYCGYDPTATSLHLGNLQMAVIQRRFQLRGHQVIALSGGGTGLIGDPSGKANERAMQETKTVAEWAANIRGQLERLLPASDGVPAPIFVDNYEWVSQLRAIDLLRDVGKYFTVNYMIAKDSVANRLSNATSGISYTEFSYMLLQALDFATLNDRYSCTLQIGGSDQWGNITAGLELIRKTGRPRSFGLTSPLILRSDGKKFGKSEEGAVWLDEKLTSPFAFYQYFVNVTDADVVNLLRRMTFLGRAEITELEEATAAVPGERRAQKRLAAELTRYVHGESGLATARQITAWLFGEGDLPADARSAESFAGAPLVVLDPDSLPTWTETAVRAGLAKSLSDARRLIDGGGIYVEDRAVTHDLVPRADDFAAGPLRLRRGRRQRVIVALGS